jgi:hypothetical protein
VKLGLNKQIYKSLRVNKSRTNGVKTQEQKYTASSLTFDSQPGVHGLLSGFIFGQALKHAGVLNRNTFYCQRTVIEYIKSGAQLHAERLSVAVPGNLRLGDASSVTRQCHGRRKIAVELWPQIVSEHGFFCKNIKQYLKPGPK